jgi:hypothetical protein
MATQLGKSMQPIEPITGPEGVTPRPFDCELDCSKLYALGMPAPRTFESGIVPLINVFHVIESR